VKLPNYWRARAMLACAKAEGEPARINTKAVVLAKARTHVEEH
jgi:hypothetical protein